MKIKKFKFASDPHEDDCYVQSLVISVKNSSMKALDRVHCDLVYRSGENVIDFDSWDSGELEERIMPQGTQSIDLGMYPNLKASLIGSNPLDLTLGVRAFTSESIEIGALEFSSPADEICSGNFLVPELEGYGLKPNVLCSTEKCFEEVDGVSYPTFKHRLLVESTSNPGPESVAFIVDVFDAQGNKDDIYRGEYECDVKPSSLLSLDKETQFDEITDVEGMKYVFRLRLCSLAISEVLNASTEFKS